MTASGTAVGRRDPVAYAMVVLSYLLMGGIAVLVDYVECARERRAVHAYGLRRPRFGRGLRASDDARRLATARRGLATARRRSGVIDHPAALLLRDPLHERRHRHDPPLHDAGLGGRGRAPRASLGARADSVCGARACSRRSRRDPRTGAPRRRSQDLAVGPGRRLRRRPRLCRLRPPGQGPDQEGIVVNDLAGRDGAGRTPDVASRSLAARGHGATR